MNRTKSNNVGLDITVIVLQSHDEATLGLDHLGNHVIDQTMFVVDVQFVKLGLVFSFVDFLEDVLESTIVLLQDGVLGGEEQVQLLADGKLERRMGETSDGFFSVSWDSWDDNWFSENSTTQDVSDGTVWRSPHLLQAELFDSLFIWSDGGTLDTNTVLLNGISRVNGDLIVGGVSGLNTQIVVLQFDIKVRQDQLVLDTLPDDSGHFITI
ncbi:hypothetical protein WICPIJ_005926 [Wickerhamomyces pijperi]|uniref:Uncharacterized protein n=1 Tax=Wickerhamomyces pijperi TaxID=599730 RepID=A0A9P8TLC8_WICPI|nr:hypothetical protein WICPIJ_005926 [Wickerhamomyces pijperi]